MLELAHLSAVTDTLARVRDAVSSVPAKVWVRGPTGSGRGTLADRLVQEIPDCIRIDLLGLGEADAVIHGLLQWEAALGSIRSGEAIPSRAERACEATRERNRVVVLKIPTSWDHSGRHESADHAYHSERLRSALDVILSAADLRLILLTGNRYEPPVWPESAGWHQFELPQAGVDPASLQDEARWGAYVEHARIVAELLPAAGGQVSPLLLRLAVGVVALSSGTGRSAALQPADLRSPPTLVDKLLSNLARVGHEEARAAVARFARARTPLPVDAALAVCRPPRGHEPLFTQCLGYGDHEVRITDDLRRRLHEALAARTPDHDTHCALADHHRARDGSASPGGAKPEAMRHWLEKTHHLAHGGARARAEWEAQDLREPEFFIDRARALSIEDRDYSSAAELYRKCTQIAPNLDYAWHYLGFNLARAGGGRAEAEGAFRRAVELDPDNPWWNGRLVNFLIDRAHFPGAEKEWAQAKERVDPDGEQIHRSPWLARELHRWVADAWLRHGEIARAREVMRDVPAEIVRGDGDLSRLEHRLRDAEEVRDLGASIHPPAMPIEQRWKPHNLPERDAHGLQRFEWFPGRVCSASAHQVELVFAVPAEDPANRRLMRKTLSAEEWRLVAGCPAELARGYVEIGTFGDPPQTRIVSASVEFLPQPEFESDLGESAFIRRVWGSKAGTDR